MSAPLTHRSSAESDEEAPPLGNAPPQYPLAPPPPYTNSPSGDEAVSPTPGPSRRGRLGSFHEGILNRVSEAFDRLRKPSSTRSTSSEEEIPDISMEEADLLFKKESHMSYPHLGYPQVPPLLLPPKVDLLPAVGDIDAFVKVPRPDEIEDNIGIAQLDEPSAKQSEPAIVDMRIKNANKEVTTEELAPVKKLAREEVTKEAIDGWIGSVKELRKNKPMPTVNLKPQIPDVETLMQELPQEVEKMLEKKEARLPSAKMDVDLRTFSALSCNMVDIPVVNDQLIPSLHQLFTLYAQFKNSQHFRNLDHNRAQSSQQPDEAERLEL